MQMFHARFTQIETVKQSNHRRMFSHLVILTRNVCNYKQAGVPAEYLFLIVVS